MARKTRRAKSKLTWRRLLAYFIPVFVGVIFIFNQANGGNVLGTKDTNFLGLFGKQESGSSREKQIKQNPTCNRVTSFSAVTICEATSEKTNNAFQSYNYTCEDGTSGSVEQKEGKCVPIAKAYELARKACHQKCKPLKIPEPSVTSIIVE